MTATPRSVFRIGQIFFMCFARASILSRADGESIWILSRISYKPWGTAARPR